MRSSHVSIAVTLCSVCFVSAANAQTFTQSKAGFFSAKSTYFSAAGKVQSVVAAESKRLASKAFKDFVLNSNRYFASLGWEKPTAPWTLNHQTTATAVSAESTAFIIESRSYTGGAHGNTDMTAATYGQVGAKVMRLTWANTFTGKDSVKSHILEAIMAKRRTMDSNAETPVISDGSLDNFAVSPGGIAWVFGQGEIGAEAEGTFIAKVPWSALITSVKADSPLHRYVLNNTVYGAWELVEFQGMDDSIKRFSGGLYTLNVGGDGRMTGRADINRFGGIATISGSSIQLDVQTSTKAMPLPGSYHDAYLKNLAEVRSAVLKGKELFLALKTDGGILKFKRVANRAR